VEKTSGFIKEHFEIIVIAVMMIGAFMINRSDLQMINNEMKDFHGRLIRLEEQYIQILKDRNN
jgi:hypothetical protein